MRCRTDRDRRGGTALGGRRTTAGRPGRPAVRHCAPADEPVPSSTYGRAADLLVRVAAVLPTPGPGLVLDDAAWAAFDELVDEAATVLVAALGHEGLPALVALADTPLTQDAVRRSLLERTLGLLRRIDLV